MFVVFWVFVFVVCVVGVAHNWWGFVGVCGVLWGGVWGCVRSLGWVSCRDRILGGVCLGGSGLFVCLWFFLVVWKAIFFIFRVVCFTSWLFVCGCFFVVL